MTHLPDPGQPSGTHPNSGAAHTPCMPGALPVTPTPPAPGRAPSADATPSAGPHSAGLSTAPVGANPGTYQGAYQGTYGGTYTERDTTPRPPRAPMSAKTKRIVAAVVAGVVLVTAGIVTAAVVLSNQPKYPLSANSGVRYINVAGQLPSSWSKSTYSTGSWNEWTSSSCTYFAGEYTAGDFPSVISGGEAPGSDITRPKNDLEATQQLVDDNPGFTTDSSLVGARLDSMFIPVTVERGADDHVELMTFRIDKSSSAGFIGVHSFNESRNGIVVGLFCSDAEKLSFDDYTSLIDRTLITLTPAR